MSRIDSSPATNAADIAHEVPSSSFSSVATLLSPPTMTSEQLATWNSILTESTDSQSRNFLLTYADEFVQGSDFEWLLDAAAQYRKEYQMAVNESTHRRSNKWRYYHDVPHENLYFDEAKMFILEMDFRYDGKGMERLTSTNIEPKEGVLRRMDIDKNRFIGFTEYALFTYQKSFDQFMTARSQLKQQTTDSLAVEQMKARITAYDAGARSYIPAVSPQEPESICIIETPRPSNTKRFQGFIKRNCVIQIFITILLSLIRM